MDQDRPAPHHPYRKFLRDNLAVQSEEVLRLLDEGVEMPIDENVMIAAEDRSTLRMALRLSVRDGRRLESWLLRRHLARITVKPVNTDSSTSSNTA
jgi:hypothetical protein